MQLLVTLTDNAVPTFMDCDPGDYVPLRDLPIPEMSALVDSAFVRFDRADPSSSESCEPAAHDEPVEVVQGKTKNKKKKNDRKVRFHMQTP